MSHWRLFVVCLESVLLSNSGWGSVAIVKAHLVDSLGVITETQLTAFLALSHITPGPLGFYLVFVGYAITGMSGALVALATLSLPSLLVIPIVRLIDRGKSVPWLRGAIAGVIVASAALMLSTAAQLSPGFRASPSTAGIAAVCVIALAATSLPSFVVVLLAALAGMVL